MPVEARTSAPVREETDDPVLATQLRRATQRFESLFFETMLKSMDESGEGNVLFGNGSGGEIYRTMVEGALSESLAEGGPLGIADMLYQKLAPAVGLSQPPAGVHRAAARAYLRHSEPIELPPGVNGSMPTGDAPGWFSRVEKYTSLAGDAARSYGIPDSLVTAVASVESDGDPAAVSGKGAEGLMQLMPATAEELGVTDPMNPDENLRGGSRYLKHLMDRFDGDLQKVLAAYNAGPSRVARYDGVPPFKETRRYVERVLERMRWLESPDGRRFSRKDVGGAK